MLGLPDLGPHGAFKSITRAPALAWALDGSGKKGGVCASEGPWAVTPQGVQPAPPIPGQLEPPLALLPSARGSCTSLDPSDHLGEGTRPKASGSGSGGSTGPQGLTPASLTSFPSGPPDTNLTSPSLGTVSPSLKNRPSGSPAVTGRAGLFSEVLFPAL